MEAVRSTVSVVIPTRFRPEALRKCLLSLLGQTQRKRLTDVMVVDDGSSPATRACVSGLEKEFAKTVPECRLTYLAQDSLGANAARNLGIRESRGSIVALMDDDAVAPETWLEELAGGLERAGVDAAGGAIRLRVEGPLIGKHREEVKSLFAEVLEPARTDDGRVVPVTCNMAARRNVFDRAMFDETVRPPVEEIDWLVRARAASVFLPDAWLWHEKSPEELRLAAALRLAWKRGSETGWWSRVRLRRPLSRRLREAGMSAWTVLFSVGHVARRRCVGGLLTAAGEAARLLAVLGLINRGVRSPRSWR
ncbi:MAG: glycosyltransferase [Nitrospirae bacterium]|nr:glycosyltransferase [Nitrospirota bacterium]